MSKLTVNFASCVHSRSVLAECRKCEDACEVKALKIDGQTILFEYDECTSCMACIPVCPNFAINHADANLLGFVQEFLDSDLTLIDTSKQGFSPLVLDEQTLLTVLLLKNKNLSLMASQNEKPLLQSKIDRINGYIKALKLEVGIDIREGFTNEQDETKSDRRSFFRAFTSKNIISAARDINNKSKIDGNIVVFGSGYIDYSDIREKKLPIVRETLLSVLTGRSVDENVVLEPMFSTDKFIDSSCTNCELCCNLCPTGALSTVRLKNSINFESYKCIKCAMCENVCESKSISSLTTFDLTGFVNKRKKELIKFKIARCASCSSIFSPQADEYVCPRCKKEDEDAMELSGFF